MVYAAEFHKGSCNRNSVYLQMSSVLNHFKNINPLKLKLCGISLHQKLRNSVNSLIRNSVEFRATLYTIWHIWNKKTYRILYKRNSEKKPTYWHLQSVRCKPSSHTLSTYSHKSYPPFHSTRTDDVEPV
jgi:hypothetical protein